MDIKKEYSIFDLIEKNKFEFVENSNNQSSKSFDIKFKNLATFFDPD